MASYTDVSYETALLHSSLSAAIETFDCWEYLLAHGEASDVTETIVTDAATIHGEGSIVANGLAVETLTIHSSVDYSVDLAPTIVQETATLSATAQSGATSTAYETATLHSSLVASLASFTTEVARVLDSIPSSKTRFTTLITEQAELSSGLPTNNTAVLTETALLHSTLYSQRRSSETAFETAVLNDAAIVANVITSVLADSAALSDSVTNRSTGYTDVTEIGYVSGQYFGTKHTAWVSSLKQLAMSRYDNLSSTCMLKVGDTVIGAGDEGLYVFDRATPVEASVTTGKLDFGSDFRKRAEAVYAVGESEAPLQVDVTVDNKGTEQTYSYGFGSRLNESTRNTRAKTGRGLSSRYYQFKLTNPGGTFFAARAASVDVGVTSRRT